MNSLQHFHRHCHLSQDWKQLSPFSDVTAIFGHVRMSPFLLYFLFLFLFLKNEFQIQIWFSPVFFIIWGKEPRTAEAPRVIFSQTQYSATWLLEYLMWSVQPWVVGSKYCQHLKNHKTQKPDENRLLKCDVIISQTFPFEPAIYAAAVRTLCKISNC